MKKFILTNNKKFTFFVIDKCLIVYYNICTKTLLEKQVNYAYCLKNGGYTFCKEKGNLNFSLSEISLYNLRVFKEVSYKVCYCFKWKIDGDYRL